MKIAVLDDYQDVFRSLKAYSRLAGHEVMVFHDPPGNLEGLVRQLSDADAVVLTMQRTAIPASILKDLPRLKLISQTGRNTGHIDLDACTRQGIMVCAGHAGGPSATAELAWALILASQRNIVTEAEALKQGRWQTTLGVGLAGKTLGVYAYGRIGSYVAQIGKAFGMNVVCWGREKSMARAREAGFASAANREEFFESTDVLSLHLPLNPETAGIVRASDLARMKPDSLLVNTSR
ncbi:MAG TPA: D-2-hydroxyacid dehydrogenase family protein, partial [Gemmataceae bacterium]|nr:D-2-hydroxyacid dehydrogenase family protein [Gemmataceae bacterium]